jgi:type VI secretion system protein ImpJ
MRQLQPVLWTKGVLLSPQHLQLQDRFFEDSLNFQLSSLTFSPWGLLRLEIDRESLTTGMFGIRSASGIFRDGLLIDLPLSDPAPPPRPLAHAFGPDQRVLDVYLAVAEHRDDGRNVDSLGQDANARYRASDLMLRDETSGKMERPIQVARKNLRLLLEGESLEGFSVLRVARVVRSPVGAYDLEADFIPPLIDVRGSEHLMTITRRLVEMLTAKSSEVAKTRRQKNLSLAEFGVADVASFWLLHTVNTYLPRVRHVYETRGGHPQELYETLVALAGALTTFSTRIRPQDLPPYEHDNLTHCFTRLDEALRELLESVVPATVASLPMRVVQPSMHVAALDHERYLAAPQMFIAFTPEGRPADVAARVPQLLKVSAANQLDHLVRQALPGLTLTYVPTPPTAIPIRTNALYYQLTRSGPDWEAILKSRNVAAHVPSELGSPQLELVIMLPQP